MATVAQDITFFYMAGRKGLVPTESLFSCKDSNTFQNLCQLSSHWSELCTQATPNCRRAREASHLGLGMVPVCIMGFVAEDDGEVTIKEATSRVAAGAPWTSSCHPWHQASAQETSG